MEGRLKGANENRRRGRGDHYHRPARAGDETVLGPVAASPLGAARARGDTRRACTVWPRPHGPGGYARHHRAGSPSGSCRSGPRSPCRRPVAADASGHRSVRTRTAASKAGQVADARDERVAQDRARDEDMVGEATCRRLLFRSSFISSPLRMQVASWTVAGMVCVANGEKRSEMYEHPFPSRAPVDFASGLFGGGHGTRGIVGGRHPLTGMMSGRRRQEFQWRGPCR